MKIHVPKYQEIAADIAGKIASGAYKEGERIYIRSSLVSQYGVSSETTRRAVSVLSDMGIVEATKGSGVRIVSRRLARDFAEKFDSISQMSDLKHRILDEVDRQISASQAVKELVSDLMYRTERFRSVNPFAPFEIEVDDSVSCLGKSLSDLNFWHNTAATVVAIRRGDKIIISPGPYASFEAGDVVYYVGDEGCHERVRQFLYGSQ